MAEHQEANKSAEAPSSEESTEHVTQEKAPKTRSLKGESVHDEAESNAGASPSAVNLETGTPTNSTSTPTSNDNNNDSNVEVLQEPSPVRSANPSRSFVSSIVVRPTEENLNSLQSDLHHASVALLRSLGMHLSQQQVNNNSDSLGGITLPAAAVGWLASASQADNIPTTRLTHLRLTRDTWPKQQSASNRRRAPPRSSALEQQQYSTLEAFHRLRFNPQVDVAIFPALKVLLLDQVPPDWVVHLPKLRDTLEVLRVERVSLHDLKEFLLGSGTTATDPPVFYSQLSHVKLTHCKLEETRGLAAEEDDSEPNSQPLAKMPRLTFLSLAHNEISSEKTIMGSGISEASMLTKLDVSRNMIPSMLKAPLYIGNLQTLVLTGNLLESADGIDRLYALQTLALDHNRIRSWLQVRGLARLPELKLLKLRGNPFMETSPVERNYVRVMLLDLFRDQRWASSVNGVASTFRQLEFMLPIMDGKPVSDRELKALQQRAFVTVPARAQNVEEPSNRIISGGSDRNGETTPLSEDWTLVAASRGVKRKKRKAAKATIQDEPTANESNGAIKRTVARSVSANTATCRGVPVESGGESLVSHDDKEVTDANLAAAGMHMKPRVPKVSFGVNDVIMSLISKSKTTTNANQENAVDKPAQKDETMNSDCLQHEDKRLLDSNNECSDDQEAASPTEFEWPQPLSYLPKENLYKEFVWTPPTAISLSEEKQKKNKMRKKKKTPTKKLKKRTPPTIKAEGEAQVISAASTVKKSTKGNGATAEKKTTMSFSLAVSPGGTLRSSTSPKKRENRATEAAEGGLGWALASKQSSSIQDEEEAAKEGHVPEPGGSVISDSLSSMSRRRENQLRDDSVSIGSGNIRSVSSDDGDANDLISPNSISGAAFPAMAMETDDLTCSSRGTNMSNAGAGGGGLKGPSRQDKFRLAEVKSKFLGMEQERRLTVASNLELYFQNFVFPDFLPNFDQVNDDKDTWQSVFFRYPRIQLLPKDRDLRESFAAKQKPMELQSPRGTEDRERLVKVWKEDIVACGKPALRRLPPNRTAHFGFHGELSWLDGKVKTVSECRQVILCLSNTSFYVVVDNDSLTEKEEQPSPRKAGSSYQRTDQTAVEAESSPAKPKQKVRKFAAPLPADATFEQALWPHAAACHPLCDIIGITIGFGFQRVALRIRNSAYPSAVEYTYQLLTSNKMKTVNLLRDLQNLVKEAKLEVGHTTSLSDEAIKIDNDDKQFLDALAAAVAPEPLGAVLHYQILKQRWKHGQRGAVSRICVVTDAKLFLLDEDYVGDGSQSVGAESGRRLALPSFRLIDAADLKQIAEVKAADADPNAITIIIRPSQTLQRTHRWRLLCRDRSGAEKLVEDARKAVAMVD